ncbi:hypothetical protein V1523DRAFT_361222 [Lipomyces doorenjongii]
MSSYKPYEEISPTTFHPPQFELERELLQRFIHLHTSQPDHEIFGERTEGLLRLPLYDSQKPTGQSWASICKRIALKVSNEMGSSVGPNDCWLSRTRDLAIYYGSRHQEKFVDIFRLLCFIADPTPRNWGNLSRNGAVVYYRPPCRQHQNNGHTAYCINGIYHGSDGSRTTRTSSLAIALSTQPSALIGFSMPHSVRLNLEQRLLQLFIDLHTSNPNHEIFGEPAQDLVRLPLYSSRKNDNCWEKVCRNIALGVVKEMGSDFQLQACWMSRNRSILVARCSNGKRVTFRNISIVRLLAFLAEPTDLHWKYLSDNASSAFLTPFSHACNRGKKRGDGQVAYCINGLYHGRFATISENASHKACGNRARPLCPGHGSPPVKCIYTNPMAA